MTSYLAIQNLTPYPVISIYCGESTVFADVPKGNTTKQKKVPSGSLRVEIFNNFMQPITLMWLPMKSNMQAKLIIRKDTAEFIPLS